MAQNDPMTEILGVMREVGAKDNPPTMLVGEVIAPPPAIQIRINDIVLDRKDVWISEYLLAGYRREARGHIKSGTQPASCCTSHAHGIDNDYTDDVVYTDTLKPGDKVSVMPMSGSQQYIVLDKVVHL